MIPRWLRRFWPCAHKATYFERRALHGVDGIAHHVCFYCGDAWPVIQRPPDELQIVKDRGAVKPYVAIRRAQVIVMPRRERQG